MNRYKNVSRSRSKERHFDDYYERNKCNLLKKELEEKEDMKRELNKERTLDNLKEEQRIKQKNWEIERYNFLKRENYLLKKLNQMKNKYSIYNQEIQKKFHNEQNDFQKYDQAYYPKNDDYDNQRSHYQSYGSFNIKKNFEEKEKNFLKYDEKRGDKHLSELNQFMSNFKEEKNNEIHIKLRKKIYLPNKQGVNLVGLLIGPKGIFLKHLEKKSGCKIYVNGKTVGKRERYINPNDNDQNHVLIIADSEEKLKKGSKLVEDVIYADEDTRNKIISEQLKASKQEGFESLNFGAKNTELNSDDYLMTKEGPPSKNSRYYKVPDDCIGPIIGKNGEIIKKIEIESNCKVQIAKAPIPNSKLRYVFIEGNEENYQIAKELIEQVIGEYVNKKLYQINN